MTKLKIAGLIIAFLLLAAAIIGKMLGADLIMVLLTVGVWVLTVIEIISYRTSGLTDAAKKSYLWRVVSMVIIAVILALMVAVRYLAGA